jgi:hypothetical protein
MRTFEDPRRTGILFSLFLQFGNHVRQEMHLGGAVLRLRIDDFLVPYRPYDDQLAFVQETLNIGCRTSRKPEPANARLNLWALYKFTYPFMWTDSFWS